jgi:hypothetical protein
LYQDAKDAEDRLQSALDVIEIEYQKTGADLSDLIPLLQTPGSNEILNTLSEVPVENYQQRTKHSQDRSEILAKNIEIIKDKLFVDIAQAQQIIKGGRPGIGSAGGLSEDWDMEDIGYEAYKLEYGENELVKNYFENIPGDLRESLNALELTDLSKTLKEEAARKHKKQAGDTKIEKKATDASLYLGTLVKDASISSRLLDYDSYATVAASPDKYDEESVENASEQMLTIKADIAESIAALTGETINYDNFTETEANRLEEFFSNYTKAHAHATGRSEMHLGQTGEASYAWFEGLIEDSWNNYLTKDKLTRDKLDIHAQKIFGFTRKTFSEFIEEYRKYRADALLGSLGPSEVDIILDEGDTYDDLFDDGDY